MTVVHKSLSYTGKHQSYHVGKPLSHHKQDFPIWFRSSFNPQIGGWPREAVSDYVYQLFEIIYSCANVRKGEKPTVILIFIYSHACSCTAGNDWIRYEPLRCIPAILVGVGGTHARLHYRWICLRAFSITQPGFRFPRLSKIQNKSCVAG